ncbi:MAG: isoprenyl transferase [Chloroflexi bacterium]|nr:isoprenyl transferase [Chloroflexota bacterium]
MTSILPDKTGNVVRTGPQNGTEPEHVKVPRHVAIIMDGNGRWAKARGLHRSEGHRAGYENLRRVVAAAAKAGVEYLTLFAFSTENWDRPTEEVTGILSLAAEVIKIETEDLHRNGIRVKHVGRLDRLPESLQSEIRESVELTRKNTGMTLGVAFDYGGRFDIVQAVQRIIKAGVPADEVDEDLLSGYLFTSSVPDPDLVIRTGGEFRISNFLLWQSAYAEFYSSEVYWPDFDGQHLHKAFKVYTGRERRFGRV